MIILMQYNKSNKIDAAEPKIQYLTDIPYQTPEVVG